MESAREGRNIVLCFDGTGDWVASDQTNVAKIYAALDREGQIAFYDGGIGTLLDGHSLLSVTRIARNMVDLGTGVGLRDKVLNGYLFLVQHYRPGDRIFMFGFSRGAYTARLVASMLRNFGLLRADAAHLAPYLWQTLTSTDRRRDPKGNKTKGWQEFELARDRIREGFSLPDDEDPRVDFMGLFDTVSSIGVVGRFQVHPNTDHNRIVRRICHAVAMDEERNAFPEHLVGRGQRNTTEVWFPGVHRDVGGGGNKDPAIPDATLGWIAGEAQREGLRLQRAFPAYDPDPQRVVRADYPLFDPYVFLGLYPMNIFSKRFLEYRLFWPNFRHVRTIPENALVHEIAKALPKDPRTDQTAEHWPREPVWFPENAAPPDASHYQIRPVRPNLGDLAGMVLGLPTLVLVWFGLMGSPYLVAWPVGTKPFAIGLLLLTLIVQGVGRPIVWWLPSLLRPRRGAATVAAIAFVSALLWLRFPPAVWPWPYVLGALAIPLWLWTQVYPVQLPPLSTSLPVMRMDSVLAVVIRGLVTFTLVYSALTAVLFLLSLFWVEVSTGGPPVWALWCALTVSSTICMIGPDTINDRRRAKEAAEHPKPPTSEYDDPDFRY